MSELGSITGKLHREEQFLRKLNEALLVLEADTLGRSSDFNFSSQQISESRAFLVDFAQRLCFVLKQQSPSIDLLPVIRHLRSGMKPVEDWIEDLEELIHQLQGTEKLTYEVFSILEEILSLLDSEFADDLQRLYSR